MNKFELVKIHQSLLEMMSNNGIKTSDVCFVNIYEDFVKLREKEKYSVSISELSKKYGLSERTISRAISKLQKEVCF